MKDKMLDLTARSICWVTRRHDWHDFALSAKTGSGHVRMCYRCGVQG